MKAIVGTFLPLCIFSFLAFAISVVVLGVDNDKSDRDTLQSSTTVMTESYTDIVVTADALNLRLFPSKRGDTVIMTNGNDIYDISAEVIGSTLEVHCGKHTGSFGDFINTFKNMDKYYVDIAVPESVYNGVTAKVNAGKTEIIGISAKDVDLELNAGSFTYAAAENHISDNINANINAGECIIFNAATKNYDFSISAGDMNIYGLTGSGSIEASAGALTANYAQLNGDVMVDVTAGSIELNLPEDASAEVSCDKTAGEVTIKHGSINKSLSDGAEKTIGNGEYKISCSVSAGSTTISDRIRVKNAPSIPALRHDVDKEAATTAITTSATVTDHSDEPDIIEEEHHS